MVNDLTGEKKASKEAVLQAISSLQERGSDINPYAVATEMGIPRQLIARNPEFMRLLADARGTHSNGNSTSEKNKAPAPTSESAANKRVQELEAYNATLRQRIQQMQAELAKLRSEVKAPHPVDASLHEELGNLQSESSALREQIAKLKEEVESASKSVNIAWQQGYLAGQHAMSEDSQQKNFIDTLAEAASAATTYSAEEPVPVAVASAAVDALGPEDTISGPEAIGLNPQQDTPMVAADASADQEQIGGVFIPPAASYIAEALHLDDPDVLNDPFTAKLLGALTVDLETAVVEGSEPEPDSEPAVAAAYEEPYPEMHVDSHNGDVQVEFEHVSFDNHHVEQPDLAPQASSPEVNVFSSEPDGIMVDELADDEQDSDEDAIRVPGSGVREEMEETTTFSADELHTLFRNKYVRPDADPSEACDPSVSGTFPSFKKFVGTNKTASSDPVPKVSRVFSPEVRKACRLLGLNPEELSRAVVTEAWKNQMAKPGVHPDTGGDTEMAIYLNTAKDTLMRWIDDQAPKLGKKFGKQETREQPKPRNKQE